MPPQADTRSVCNDDLLPSPYTVARAKQYDMKSMLRIIEGPALDTCPGATVVVAVHGAPDEVLRMLAAVRAYVQHAPPSPRVGAIIVGGILDTGYNLNFHDPDFGKRVLPILVAGTQLPFWSGSDDPSEIVASTRAYDAATASISALGFLGLPGALEALQELLRTPDLEAQYNSATIRIEVLDAAQSAKYQVENRKAGALPVRIVGGQGK